MGNYFLDILYDTIYIVQYSMDISLIEQQRRMFYVSFTQQYSVGIMAAPLFHHDEIRVANFVNS